MGFIRVVLIQVLYDAAEVTCLVCLPQTNTIITNVNAFVVFFCRTFVTSSVGFVFGPNFSTSVLDFPDVSLEFLPTCEDCGIDVVGVAKPTRELGGDMAFA